MGQFNLNGSEDCSLFGGRDPDAFGGGKHLSEGRSWSMEGTGSSLRGAAEVEWKRCNRCERWTGYMEL